MHWSISPSLPEGLSLDSNTGKITGTPTEVMNWTDYNVTLTAKSTGGTIDLTSAGGSTAYTIVSGAGTDTLKGDDGNDTFTISAAGEGNNDTIDGDAHTGGSGDTIQLSTGSHTFSTDGKI